VRPEWVNKWPTNIIADDEDDDDDDDDDDTKFFPHETYKSSCTSYFRLCTTQISFFISYIPSFIFVEGRALIYTVHQPLAFSQHNIQTSWNVWK
jgi:hypothetical protein